ncbi:MAG TPA: NAD-dependent protein deacetylase [Nevskiaceae bacterium]
MNSGSIETRAASPAQIADWLMRYGPAAVITGAGVSTGSGIPDYRDANGQWKRPAPMQHADFVHHATTRQRYWARSFVGWRHFAAAQPNAAHEALAELERLGLVDVVITQNVDGLHERAGSREVIDLHGRLDRVACLQCHHVLTRDRFQGMLEAANQDWHANLLAVAPDGDADLAAGDYARFQVPSCPDCGGVLMPAVVFYGGTLDPATRAAALAAVSAARALLVVGSSLMVWSAFSLVREAAARRLPIAAINRGHTRADDLLTLKCEQECGSALAAVVRVVQRPRGDPSEVPSSTLTPSPVTR